MIGHEWLRISWASGQHFLDSCSSTEIGQYTVTLPRESDLPPNLRAHDTLPVELEFLNTEQRFRHRGVVVQRERHALGDTLVLGFAPSEQEIRALVMFAAKGEKLPYLHRRSERVAVWLPVTARIGNKWVQAIVSDMSELGTFLSVMSPPQLGTKIEIRAEAGSTQYLELTGRVVHVGSTGCGIEFIFSDRNHEVRVRTAIRAALQKKSR